VNIVTVSTCRRPFHTRLCLESICRAQRWHPWADKIAVCWNLDRSEDLAREVEGVIERNPDIPLQVWCEPTSVASAHDASGWMLSTAFDLGARCTLYVEDDVILGVDSFVVLDWCQQALAAGRLSDKIIGCTLYHETIPAHYTERPPDPRLLHLCPGINTCGGTAFFREPYLQCLKPDWNCKQVEPKGFDYSAHYLMYRHGLYMVYPDYGRSMNCGFTAGSIAQETWAQYFGRSIWVQTHDAARSPEELRIDVNGPDSYPGLVRETWMVAELEYRGLL